MSVSDDIHDNIVATLKAINGIPTFVNTMRDNQVQKGEVHFDKVPKDAWPSFSVIFNSEPRERLPGQYRKELDLDILCAFHRRQDTPHEAWLADIEKALLTDITRNGLAFETFVNNIERETQFSEEPQIYIMNVTVSTLVDVGVL